MIPRSQKGFTLIEMLISITVLLLALGGLAGLLIQNSRVNKSERMAVEVQANARNCLSVIVQRLRSAGWDPLSAGIPTVLTDQIPGDGISEITVYADFDLDGAHSSTDEEVLIRHVGNQILWRRSAGDSFVALANNISNDADGNGSVEPMFIPDVTPNPTRVTVQITARSPVPDPTSGEFIRYTVSSDVVFRKAL